MAKTEKEARPNAKVKWHDRGREPQCAPDPAYPHGIILDASDGAAKTCAIELPYPAKRCGVYEVKCKTCKQVVALTTAGRPDDPRVVKMGCFMQNLSNQPGTKIITQPKKEAYVP